MLDKGSIPTASANEIKTSTNRSTKENIMKANTIVRPSNPMQDEDPNQKYRVVEDRDARVLCVAEPPMPNMPIQPQFVFQTSDVEVA